MVENFCCTPVSKLLLYVCGDMSSSAITLLDDLVDDDAKKDDEEELVEVRFVEVVDADDGVRMVGATGSPSCVSRKSPADLFFPFSFSARRGSACTWTRSFSSFSESSLLAPGLRLPLGG